MESADFSAVIFLYADFNKERKIVHIYICLLKF